MIAALIVGVLVASGVYLILQSGIVRMTIGFVLLGHAANVLLLAAGGLDRTLAPLLGTGDPELMADPVPMAFALTAIVITFGVFLVLLAVARLSADRTGDDATEPGEMGGPL